MDPQDTTPVTVTEEVEVATTPPPTFEAKEEEMFLSFLEEFENIPKKPMHADDMAIMALMGPVSPGTTTSVPEQTEATTRNVAPSLDHDDETLFLSFLEDHENLQTTTVQAESSTEAVEEEDDVFGVEIIEDSSIEGVKSESLPEEDEDSDESDEYPELVTDYFDLSDNDETNREEEEADELEPIEVDDSVSDDDLGDTDSKERPGKDSLVKLILNLT